MGLGFPLHHNISCDFQKRKPRAHGPRVEGGNKESLWTALANRLYALRFYVVDNFADGEGKYEIFFILMN